MIINFYSFCLPIYLIVYVQFVDVNYSWILFVIEETADDTFSATEVWHPPLKK